MRVPTIFTWPIPWLWGALALIIIMDANGFSEVLGRTCAIFIVASIIHCIRGRRGSGECSDARGNLSGRLAEIERRLTDTQDVMIALSEKVDRWEQDGRRAGGEGAARSREADSPLRGGPTL